MSSPFPDPCANCGAPLARDQRYCLTCGERVGPLPAGIAELLGTVAAPPAVVEADADAPEGDGDERRSMVSPRAAALAVLGVLAFGSVLGTVISPAASSLASAPVLVAVAPPAGAPAPVAPADTATTPDDTGDADTPAADDSSDATDTSSADSGSSDSPASDDSGGAGTAPAAYTAPKVKHMFVIVLSGHGYADAFGPDSKATYLAKTLPAKGEVINNYYAATQGELANGIALISGQGPTAQTQLNCPNYGDLATTGTGDDDQVLGDGCVYPATAKTLGDQLKAGGKTWKAYVEDIGNGAAGDATTCRHPTLGSPDPLQAPRPGDAYVTWRNPFVYFHSLLDGTDCANSDAGLSQLGFDLTSADTTPAVSFIVPNRCHDGSDTPCADGAPAGMTAADDWLKTTVPQIMGSKAFADGGLLAITFDQAPQTGDGADATSCCTPAAFPNVATTAAPASTAVPGTTALPATTALPPTTAVPGTTATPGSTATPGDTAVPADPSESPGGGRVGLLLLGDAVKPGSVDLSDSYNHFSLLRSIEDLFGLDHLGYAADPAMPAFDKAVYNGKR